MVRTPSPCIGAQVSEKITAVRGTQNRNARGSALLRGLASLAGGATLAVLLIALPGNLPAQGTAAAPGAPSVAPADTASSAKPAEAKPGNSNQTVKGKATIGASSQEAVNNKTNITDVLNNTPVSMEFRDVELQEVIRMIAEKAHLNVLFDPSVVAGNKVTFKLENVKLINALDNILKTRGLTYIITPEENILRVVKASTMALTGVETVTEILPLKYLYAPRAVATLKEIFTPQAARKTDNPVTGTANSQGLTGAQPGAPVPSAVAYGLQTNKIDSDTEEKLIAISYHLESNSLLLVAPPIIMKRMKNIIEQLDKPENALTKPITKIVEVNWMDADDLIEVLGKVFLSTNDSTKFAFGGGDGSLITITKAAATAKPITDTGAKDSDKQVRTRLQGIDEPVLGAFSPSYKNALVLTAPPVVMEQMLAMVKELDVPQQQVQIEARLVEMTNQATRDLGSQLELANKKLSPNSPLAGEVSGQRSNLFNTGVRGVNPIALPAAEMAFGKNISVFGSRYNLSALLQAYEERELVTTLANTRVVTLNKQVASMSFTEKIPYVTTTFVGGGGSPQPTVNFEKAGVDVGVLPTASQNGNVHMAVKVSQLIHVRDLVVTNYGNVPVIDTRNIQGQVIANSNDTVVMGGLRTLRLRDSTVGTPWLHQVPVFGWLFKNKTNSADKTELFIFITPRILNDVLVTPEQKAHYDKIDTNWHMPDYFFDDVKTPADKK